MSPELNLIHLYPTLLNLYGDRGNIITLAQRCAWRGIRLNVHEIGPGEGWPDVPVDLAFMGGDQDREQAVVVDDLRTRHTENLRGLIDAGTPLLAVCGSFQLLQRSYRAGDGSELIGAGIFNAHTVHPGHDVARCVGNIVVDCEWGTMVGFENHGGRTYLDGDTKPFGRVVKGFGNNGQDGLEGARTANAFGTYVHGSLLPKNPAFADLLLSLALARRFPGFELGPLDDRLENIAHDAAMRRVAG